jgi:cell fate (sporulation/competence/biofilm development) regulator YlbF (YheA/YmcA/DUF963 family)
MITDGMTEKAHELGRLIGQAEEFKALERARERFENDREAIKHANRLGEIETDFAEKVERNERPSEELREEYERVYSELQSNASYQAMIAAQSNFDRIIAKVNDEISKGVESGAKSRIILPS